MFVPGPLTPGFIKTFNHLTDAFLASGELTFYEDDSVQGTINHALLEIGVPRLGSIDVVHEVVVHQLEDESFDRADLLGALCALHRQDRVALSLDIWELLYPGRLPR